MFSGKLFNRFAGVSKNNNNPFYIAEILVDNADSKRVTFKTFVSEDIYKKISVLPLDSTVTVKCGVNSFGKLCVNDIITGK